MPASQPAPMMAPLPDADEGMAVLGPEGRVSAANERFASLLKQPIEALIGRPVTELLAPFTPPLAPLLDEALGAGQPVLDRELRSNGAGHPQLLLSLYPVRSRLGQSLGFDLVLRPWVRRSGGGPALAPAVAANLERLRGELAASDAPFRAIFDQAAVGFLLVGPEGGLIAANPGFCAIVGYSVEELLAARPHALTHPDDLELDREQIRRLMAGEPAPAIEKRFLRRDGTPVWTRVSRSMITGPAGANRFGLIIVQDISAERRMREAAERSAGRAGALLALTATLSRALTPERVAQAVIEAAASLQIAGAVVTLLEPDQVTLSVLAMEGYPPGLREAWQRFPLTIATPISDAARRGEPVLLGSPEERDHAYPHLARDYPASDARAWAALPLRLDTQLIGAVGLTFASPRSFDGDDRTYLMTMASLCAQALERTRLTAAERAALAAADEALAMVDRVIDSAPIGMAYLDSEFRYRRVNPRMAALNGLPIAAHIGKKASELFPHAGPIWEEYWRQVMATGDSVVDLELSAPLPNGSTRYALANFYPVRISGGAVLGVGLAVIDITERKAAEEERARLLATAQAARSAAQESLARAEDAVQLRDDFLSVAAHELKTPLTSLLGQAQLLERRLAQAEMLSGPNQRSLQVVVGQARRLSSLIGDLLDGARLNQGQLTLQLRTLELGRLARRIVDELRTTTPSHLLELRGDEGARVLGDPVRLEQVLQNLISNAVKYSPHGSVVLVEVRREGERALMAVKDQGVGIPAEAMPRLFERFYRVASPETASISGVGVGLYVVREIVRLHGGEVRVESVVGEGSSFTVELPLADESSAG